MENSELEKLIAEFLKSDQCVALTAQIPWHSIGIGKNKQGIHVIRVSTARQITSEDIRSHQKSFKGISILLEFGGIKPIKAL